VALASIFSPLLVLWQWGRPQGNQGTLRTEMFARQMGWLLEGWGGQARCRGRGQNGGETARGEGGELVCECVHAFGGGNTCGGQQPL
jgi:hypothetical protein